MDLDFLIPRRRPFQCPDIQQIESAAIPGSHVPDTPAPAPVRGNPPSFFGKQLESFRHRNRKGGGLLFRIIRTDQIQIERHRTQPLYLFDFPMLHAVREDCIQSAGCQRRPDKKQYRKQDTHETH